MKWLRDLFFLFSILRNWNRCGDIICHPIFDSVLFVTKKTTGTNFRFYWLFIKNAYKNMILWSFVHWLISETAFLSGFGFFWALSLKVPESLRYRVSRLWSRRYPEFRDFPILNFISKQSLTKINKKTQKNQSRKPLNLQRRTTCNSWPLRLLNRACFTIK